MKTFAANELARRVGKLAAVFFTGAVIFAVITAAPAMGAILPPPPGTVVPYVNEAGNPTQALIVDGVGVAVLYDQFWSYSAKILDVVQHATGSTLPLSYGDYQFSSGTGKLDVILATGANGASNQGVGPGGAFNFEDPTDAPNGNSDAKASFNGWWGQDDQDNDGTADNVNGPVTVGQVLDYLHAFNPLNNVPAFYIDYNQTGADDSVLLSAQVQLINPTTKAVVATWALDTLNDSTYEEDMKILNAGTVDVTTIDGVDHTLQHNLGSGSPDFIAVAPTMDLSLYDPTLLFVAEAHMGAPDQDSVGALNDGFEEIFLTGGIFLTNVIPEPSTFIIWSLLGSLGAAAGWWRRRRRAA